MGDAQRSAGRRIEIGVEHAAAAAKLQLETGPFANLKRGASEMADEVGGGEADELPGTVLSDYGGLNDLRLDLGLRRSAGCGHEWQDEN